MNYQKVSLIFEVETVQTVESSLQFGVKAYRKSFMAVEDDSFLDFSTFKRYLLQQVGISEKFSVKYVDEDNDQIPIESEDEFNEAIKVARECTTKGMFLKLIVNTLINESHEPDSSSKDPELFERVKSPNLVKSKMSKKKQDDKASTKSTVHRFSHNSDRGRYLSMNVTSVHRNSNDKSRSGVKSTPAVNIRTKMLQQVLANVPYSCEAANSEEATPINNEQPPAWFISYMEKYKADILLAVEEMIQSKKKQSPLLREAKPKQRVKRHSEDESSDNQLCGSEPRSFKILRKLEKLQKREKKLEHKLDQRLEKMESKKKRMLEKVSQTKTGKRKSCEGSGAVPYLMGGISVKPLSPIHIAPLQMFSRSWEILNDGTIPWTDATEMRQAWGSAGLEPLTTCVKCPPLAPGEQGFITVVFLAPGTPGTYHSYWHLFHMGERFGHWIVCTVIVDAVNAEEAAGGAEFNESVVNNSQEMEKDLADKLKAVTLDIDPEYISGSDLEVCSNVSESDSVDSFVVVDLPMSLFSDSPAESKGTIPVKVRSKNCTIYSKNDQKKNAKSSNNEPKVEAENDHQNSENNNTAEATSSDPEAVPYEPVQGSVYMVDRAGNCFITPSTQSAGIYSTVDSSYTVTYPVYTQQSSVQAMPQNYYSVSWGCPYSGQNVGCPSAPNAAGSALQPTPSQTKNFGKNKKPTESGISNTTHLPENKNANTPSGKAERPKQSAEGAVDNSPVHILPETLVSGAINVASKAFNTAQSVLSNLRAKQGEATEYDPVFECNLATLFEMGFTNTARNVEVLKSVGNNIGLAVPILLNKSCHQ